ncbi:hypothetical protein BKA70DRAFT_1421087 [Coprinopsis sp. MPI-PUGE-AT-0042]|nr:hypothetical protein BKA70DRAFT_1421087 [Coprinopsis sp. MPI-PUGE-AT-0042]
MHNFTHSLAHRAPPASRTRGRWQPYAALQSASSSSSSSASSTVSSTFSARISPANYLNNTTPATSATSSPASFEADLSRPKDTSAREGNKTKYALNLVDQSVKSLCDIWRPQDIPAVYSNSKATLAPSDGPHTALLSQRLAKPTASSSLLTHNRLSSSQPSIPTTPVLIQTGTTEAPAPLVPVRGFVHEVLKRSRTSGGVLQTALCYLEAIRPKLAELIRQEKEGTGMRGDSEPLSTITPATDEELALEAELAKAEDEAVAYASASIDTVRIDDDCQLASPSANDEPPEIRPSSPPKPSATEYAALPPLPSPLLCPRRSFLAALILASKFTQDKCYSNRAWAKLSGLSPREIGRCERALGDALDWRLWVGKAAVPAVPATTKPVSRSQSEPSILVTPPIPSSLPDTGIAALAAGLRRAATLPSDALTPNYAPMEKQERSYTSDCALYLQTPISKPDNVHSNGSSPLSDVPSLSYSPSSTESSSSGERTIQMSTFLEDNMVPPGGESSQAWPWLDSDALPGSFMMNIDGASKGGFPGVNGGYYGHPAHMSSSPVAKINGKLLTGNGLQAFQTKRHAHVGLASAASFGDLAEAGPFAANGAHIFKPQPYAIAIDVPSMG